MDFFRKETKRFSDSIDPGTTWEETTSLNYDATIEQVDIRFYNGPEGSLKVLPFRKRGNDKLPLVDLYGRPWITGNADYWRFSVSESIEEGDVIGVEVVNESDQADPDGNGWSYDATIDITLDQQNGASRVLESIRGVFS